MEHPVSLLSISDYVTTIEEIFTPMISEDHIEVYMFSSHCHGIVCRVDDIWTQPQCARVTFYNPALREHRFVFAPPKHDIICTNSYVFGHDLKTDDYKLARILKDEVCTKVEVYSLRNDRWKEYEIEEFTPSGRAVSLNGSFRSIDLPPGIDREEDGWDPWIVARGKTLACVDLKSGTSDSLGVWVMEGDGWAEQFEIEGFVFCKPIAFWKENELLVETNCSMNMSTYNLRTQQLRELDVPKGTSSLYVESLVSV